MHRYLNVLLCLVVFSHVLRDASGEIATRHKRYVAFRKGSTYFYRINYKANTLPYTTMFTQASGFKVAWELPTGARYRKRRSVTYDDNLDVSYDGIEFKGSMCLLKSLCRATSYIRKRDGVFNKIIDLLASSYEKNGTSALDPLLCENYSHLCPLQFVGLNFFNED